jgi:hypothetical protein
MEMETVVPEDYFLSKRGKRRAPSFIRQLTKYLAIPGMVRNNRFYTATLILSWRRPQ